MILQLNVSLYLANVAFSITLGLLLILIDLLFKVVLNALLKRSMVTLILFFHSLKLPHEIVIPPDFPLEYFLILLVCVFEMCELLDVITEVSHLMLCLCNVCLLSLADIGELDLVTILKLSLHNCGVLSEFLYLGKLPCYLLILFVDERLDASATLQELFVMLLNLSFKVGLLHPSKHVHRTI